MQYFIEGLLWGLFLALAVGPIFIVITQSSIEKGWKAGIAVGLGIWTSDIIYIVASYRFVKLIEPTLNDPLFKYYAGIIGGIILMLFGIYLIVKKKELNLQTIQLSARNFVQYFSKGFVVNTFNPFTPIFWFGVISTNVIARSITIVETTILMGTIIAVIMTTDSLKVFLAQKIRERLNTTHLHYISVISGSFLLIIGLVMIIRVF